jgi:predicted TIM-barrel fold metal-dependent hydrolase
MFISHCHVGAAHFGMSNHPRDGTIPRLVEILNKVGADGAVVFAPFPYDSLGWRGEVVARFADPNEWLLAQLEQYPQLRGFATVNPADRDAVEKLHRFIKAGLVGAKVHPPVHKITINDPALDSFWSAAEELQIPVHLHTGVHGNLLKTYRPLLLDDVAQAHPNLTIIMDHLGGYSLFHEALAVLHNNRNVYAGFTQTSGRYPVYHLPQERVDIVLSTVGPDRIVYGLDYPWNTDNETALDQDLAWVRSMGLSREDTNKIIGGNILRLIGQVRTQI